MKIQLKKKKLASGKYSLYLEYYKGFHIDENGKTKHHREFEYLKRYISIDPKSSEDKKKNKENLLFAEQVLSLRKADYIQGKYKIRNKNKGKLFLLDYYIKLKEERFSSKGNYGNWDAAQKHLERYSKSQIALEDIDEKFVKGFKKHLDSHAKTKSNIGLSQNSKYTYFNKIKACLKQGFEDGYIIDKSVIRVKGFEEGVSIREYLSQSELNDICSVDCRYPILKKAFIFSCLTGLRWSDIHKLVWSEIREEGIDENGNEIYRIIFIQKKTDGLEYLYISKQARELLGNREGNLIRVFKGLRYSSTFNNELLRWIMRAGITKKITFHSARHTNAVLLLSNGADIYTVQKRLGHKEIRTTEIYAKIIDSKMKEAANIIPTLNIKL